MRKKKEVKIAMFLTFPFSLTCGTLRYATCAYGGESKLIELTTIEVLDLVILLMVIF